MDVAKVTDMLVSSMKAGSDPVVVRFNRLEKLAHVHGIELRPVGDEFYIWEGNTLLHVCDTTAEIEEFLVKHMRGRT